MPIYEQSYRHYDGRFRRHARWLIVMEQELRVLIKSRIFIMLLLIAMLHVILRLLQVVAYDIIMQDPNHPLTPFLKHAQALVVDESAFFDFIRMQTPILFLTMLYAGAGMICNDFRNNLIEIYFSKPLRWYDYAFGKAFTLIIMGLVMTAIPGVFLVVLHNLLLPSWTLLQASWWWPISIVLFSLAIILPLALGILACSCLLGNQSYAAVAIFMVVIANSALAGMLAGLLKQENYLLLSFPMTLNRIGEHLFDEVKLSFQLHWHWSILYVAVVCVWAVWVLFRRIRRAEMAA